ncbi:MAG: hypothetical protein NTZ18_02060 [Candidatus Komeilibacteria bacterium]|nr:hypothetical protein [Candidatus Komeilibacteria bacterium]
MEITIDLTRYNDILNLSPFGIIWYFFSTVGWIFLIAMFLGAGVWSWLFNKRKKWLASVPFTLLAIDIPKDNEQSLMAVEQIFATLAGIKAGYTMWEKYYQGKTQLSFSLEIISLEGYIQFLIRTPEQFRDLVEAAVYAQYPEAEITEVEDYIGLIPDDIHKIGHDYKIWAAEFTFAQHSAYPIRTYKSFEHPLTQMFIDPMASLLEVMSKIGKGEQLGWQLVIAPASDDWKEKGYALIKKLLGEKTAGEKHSGDKLIDAALGGLEKFSEGIYQMWGDIRPEKENTTPNLYLYLTAGEKEVITQMENKLAKICFNSTFRVYYLGHSDVFKKGRGVNSILGAINQFNTSDMNAFKKYKRLTTHRDYFFIKTRVAYVTWKLMRLYKKRSRKGSHELMLSIEELATLYHFPTITVKAPLLKKIEYKRAEPPTSLPVEPYSGKKYFRTPPPAGEKTVEPEKSPLPALPADKPKPADHIIKESLGGYDFDNDYFEEHFAKNKQTVHKTEAPAIKKGEPPANLPISE